MIKLFSLNLASNQKTGGDVYVVNPTATSKSKAQIQTRNQSSKNESMSHLLYLNSSDNYPNKCPHNCLHLLVKQLLCRPDIKNGQVGPDRGSALYASTLPLQGLWGKYFGPFFRVLEKRSNKRRKPAPPGGKPGNFQLPGLPAGRSCSQLRRTRQPSSTATRR